MSFVKEDHRGIVFKIFVQPRSSKNEVEGLYGDALKIRIKAPPVEGAANKMCIQYLAKRLGIPKSSLEILSGHSGRTKQMLLYSDNSKSFEVDRMRQKRLVESLLIPQDK